ncbi:hypothetical protein MNV49_005851 [Pseudohyphozyma bogoriensis]|nr:hypothetical protein MNV49_005851 [Pseudohyphozyma bogoriensis]
MQPPKDPYTASYTAIPQLNSIASPRYAISRLNLRLLLVLFGASLTLFQLYSIFGTELKTSGEDQQARCSSDEFLLAIRDAKVRDGDIPSAHTLAPSTTFELPPIEFSFDLASEYGCAPMRAFGPKDACELLGKFGGVTAIGDSFMRQIWTTLLMLLRGRLDGSTQDFGRPDADPQRCAGENAFNDQPPPGYCRHQVYFDLQAREEICGAKLVGHYFREDRPTDAAFELVKARMEQDVKGKKTPILLQGFGLHFGLKVQGVTQWNANLDEFSHVYPSKRILSIWAGLHGPNEKQPEWVRESQGPEVVAKYDRKLGEVLEGVTPLVHNRMIDYFNVTLGAEHYDGVHLSYQGSMEKIQILLNYLDLVHKEIEEHGSDWV